MAKNALAKKDRKAAGEAVKKVVQKQLKPSAKIKQTTGKAPAATVTAGKKAAFPRKIAPMLATLVDQPFHEPGWLYEVKWDGYRAIALLNGTKVELLSRNGKSFSDKFYPVQEALVHWNKKMVVDGEIVVIDKNGGPDFSALQNWRSEADGSLFYYVFDLLWIDGHDLKQLPLYERKQLLSEQMHHTDAVIRFSESFETDGLVFFETVRKMGLEGMMAKKADSIYQPGERTRNWLKIKTDKRQEVVIGGYTLNEDSPKPFSSLLVGVYKKGKLHYAGKVGTGFNVQQQKQLLQQFKPLTIKKSPFVTAPDINAPSRFRPEPPQATAVWLQPKLVCEVNFREMTNDGVMRHPSFAGMRTDKKARSVVEEVSIPVNKAVHRSPGRLVKAPGKTERKTLLNPSDETQVRNIAGHALKFTNLSKGYWPAEKITKRDMLNYYYQVAPLMLPYLKDRPQTLNRFPNGINGKTFYQKDVTSKVPDWTQTYLYHSSTDERDRHFLVCTTEADLLYMANLGAIEINPWSSTIKKPDHPSWCVIDLDPDKNTFDQVIQTAQATRDVLNAIGVPSYCKTSGSTGLHIYIPLAARYTYEQSKEFGRVIAKLVHAQTSRFTSIERATVNRKGKIYIDFLQNRPQATLAAPYSLRPKPGATVSMPLHWEEVKKGLKMKDFTIHNAVSRLKAEGDIFKAVLGKGIDMQKTIKKIGVVFD